MMTVLLSALVLAAFCLVWAAIQILAGPESALRAGCGLCHGDCDGLREGCPKKSGPALEAAAEIRDEGGEERGGSPWS